MVNMQHDLWWLGQRSGTDSASSQDYLVTLSMKIFLNSFDRICHLSALAHCVHKVLRDLKMTCLSTPFISEHLILEFKRYVEWADRAWCRGDNRSERRKFRVVIMSLTSGRREFPQPSWSSRGRSSRQQGGGCTIRPPYGPRVWPEWWSAA